MATSVDGTGRYLLRHSHQGRSSRDLTGWRHARDPRHGSRGWRGLPLVQTPGLKQRRKLDATRGATYPFWSPDSKQIAFFAEGKLKRIAASGGPALPVCDAERGRGGDWSEQNIILFAPDNQSEIMQIPADGGTPKPVTKLTPGDRNHRMPVSARRT